MTYSPRVPERAVRITACVVTLLSLIPMMIVQLAGVGQLLAFILGFPTGCKTGCIAGARHPDDQLRRLGGMRGTA